jgi:hypothetical protein
MGRKPLRRGALLEAEEIVHAVRMMALQLGEPMTFHRFVRHSGVPGWQVYRHFRSWYEVREAAGLPRKLPCSRKVPAEQLLKAFHQVTQKLRRFPTPAQFERLSEFGYQLMWRRVGPWDRVKRQYRAWLDEQEDLAVAAGRKRAGSEPAPDQSGEPVRDVGWIRDVWQKLRVKFETESRQFQGRDPGECDLLVVLDHNWLPCPVPVVELRAVGVDAGEPGASATAVPR